VKYNRRTNIFRHAIKLVILTLCFYPASSRGTFFVAGISHEYAVVAIDSRELRGRSINNEYCKIQPLSRNAFFFGRGSTSAIDTISGVEIFDARTIARRIYVQFGIGTTQFATLSQTWADQVIQIYNRFPKEFSALAVDGLMSDAFFVGIDENGHVTFAGQSISYQPYVAIPFFANPEPVEFGDPAESPKYVAGYHEIMREFRNGGETERAKKVLSNIDPSLTGPDFVAAKYMAIVEAVEKWTGDTGIGGETAAIILESGKGWRWFRRPNFCPKE
jgi:hypothetical protein